MEQYELGGIRQTELSSGVADFLEERILIKTDAHFLVLLDHVHLPASRLPLVSFRQLDLEFGRVVPGVCEGEHGGDVTRRVLLEDLVNLVAGLWLRVESELHQLPELGGNLDFAPGDWLLLDLSVNCRDEADRNVKQVFRPLQKQYAIVGYD